MNTFPTTYCPTTATTQQTVPRILKAQFGNGYTQEELDGINAYLRLWDVYYENIPTSGLLALNTFLETNAGTRFYWTQPAPFDAEGQKVFRCDQWQWTYQGGNIVSLECQFQQQPES